MVALETPRTPVAALTASGTLTAGKHTPVTASTAGITVTLPTGVNAGAHLSVEKTDATGWPVTITGSIRGAASSNLYLYGQGDAVVMAADAGGSWWPMPGGQNYRPIDQLSGFTSTAFPNFRKAVAKARAGTADAKILCVGDSVFGGSNGSAAASVPASKSIPAFLQAMLNTQVTSAPGLAFPTTAVNSTDTRWTFGASWTKSSGFGFAGSSTSGTTTALTFTDSRVTWDRIDVYYHQTVTASSFSTLATGGSTTTTTATNATAGIGKVTVSAAAAATSNTLTITGISGTSVIIGVEPWLSTATKVRVGNVGVNSTYSLGWADSAQGAYSSTNAIKAYAPDLTIINLGVNDGVNGYTVSAVLTAMQTIIAAAQVSGDVIVVTPFSMNPAIQPGGAALEPQYVTSWKSGLGVPIADWYARMGSWAAYNTAGLTADERHPNDAGSYDAAAFIWKALQRVM